MTLTLSATDDMSGVTQMRFSNDNVTWSAWETYATSKSWTLDAALGTKTVYVQFKDGVGNVSPSVTDTIALYDAHSSDRGLVAADQLQLVHDHEQAPQSSWRSRANDIGGSGLNDMRFSNDGVTWSDWEPTTPRNYGKPWTLDPGPVLKTVYFQYRDGAGNTTIDSRSIRLLDGIARDDSVTHQRRRGARTRRR